MTDVVTLVDNGDGTFTASLNGLPDGTFSVLPVTGSAERIGVQLGNQLLTGVDGNGTSWSTSAITGWGGSPASSLTLTQKLRAPGAWVSPRQLTPRVISIDGQVYASGPDALRVAEDALNTAASLDATTLTVIEGAMARVVAAYRQDVVLFEWDTDRLAHWSVQMVAADPRKYGPQVSATTGLSSTSGGFSFPATFPLTVSGVVTSGQVGLTNPGNATGPVVLAIAGPITGPVITHVGSGLQVAFSSSLNIASGQTLYVDMEAQTVLLNNQASRSGYVQQRGWFGLEPGNNVFSFAATSGSGHLTVTATPAWL